MDPEPIFHIEDQFSHQNGWKKRVRGFLTRNEKLILTVLSIIVLAVALYHFLISPTADFPKASIVHIERGSPLVEISKQLKEENIIRSEAAFQFFVILFAGDRRIVAGDYYFADAVPVFETGYRMAHGKYGFSAIKTTLPEGSTAYEMSQIFSKKLPYFSKEQFLNLAEEKEGYLFPDTYLFFPAASASDIVSALTKNFEQKISTVQDKINASGKSTKDIVIMASIIEKEANKPEDRRIVSGILWKRIKTGMALQVDAPFLYIDQDKEREVTLNDLKIDSPYNTYTHRGLTPGPIGNPGLDAIIAAAEPKSSPYLFYLYDKSGTIHYARTFDEHKANKMKYLR